MNIVESKITIPLLPEAAVKRRSLLERLDQIPRHKLTVLCAPAGYGKTTLLSQWITVSGHKVGAAWVSLNERENNPARFWHYFIQALNPLSKTDLADWLAFADPPSEDALDLLIRRIATEIPSDFILVLDDFHMVANELLHQQIAYLVDYLPANMHLVIATRTRMPLQTVQPLIRNQLIELTREDLKFTQAEAEAFLGQSLADGIAPEMIARLNARTEGWVAGLQIAALSLQAQSHPDAENFLKGFNGRDRYIFDYLAGQVYAIQPKEI